MKLVQEQGRQVPWVLLDLCDAATGRKHPKVPRQGQGKHVTLEAALIYEFSARVS